MKRIHSSTFHALGDRRRIARTFLISVIATILLYSSNKPAFAFEDTRSIQEEVVVQAYRWQLLQWNSGQVACDFNINHVSWPTINDVGYACGDRTAKEWSATPNCDSARYGGNSSNCVGLMLSFIGEVTYSENRTIILPSISMHFLVTDCQPGQWCDTRPSLKLIAEEPLEGYEITKIHVRVENKEKEIIGNVSEIRLPTTGENGAWLEYWAESNFGDTSEILQVRYRAYPGTQNARQIYRFDLLSEEWASSLPGCAILWNIFPPAKDNLPKIFEQPLSPEYLTTTNRYSLLAGHLIRDGVVDGSSCPNGGLTPYGTATACGEKVAAKDVFNWQNKYDQQIFDAGIHYSIPPGIIKGVIAQESQFWPESSDPGEHGLGYITENGISLLLSWNLEYFSSVCLPVYGESICAGGYTNMRKDLQEALRGIVYSRIGTNLEIDLIAASLYASAAQTQQMIKNVARAEPSEATTYEDMWKITIANYYAGSGCIGNALRTSQDTKYPLSWGILAKNLEGICISADDYVRRVMENSN